MIDLKVRAAILSGLVLCSLIGARPDSAEPLTLRVLTYNIHHAEGRDGRVDLPRIADVIRSARPDLVALQEVDRGTARTGGVDQLAELARMLGMHAEFGKAIDLQGGAYGVAILSRWPVASSENHPLPSSPDYEPRTALTVRFRAGEGGPWLRFTSTHLDNSRDADEKLGQARHLSEVLTPDDAEPAILAGDFNARPGTDALQTIETRWTNALPDDLPPGAAGPPAATAVAPPAPGAGVPEPSRPPQQRRGPRGDFVLFRPVDDWRVLESRSIDDNVASDHRPVLTVLEWIEGG